ncbi:SDR family oxidoreductase [Sphingomonas sp. CGMCC 1.13654]|uniref:SDR family oxidoreductase n=1 Tax=Sphingomonas chungangi TaxID=2683589 RepID=A0A838L3W3_9SPHN|nr:SDR family NAD(P)-dependent oxidoreductase [Sphingomonas chungangi]MBA2933737.1 SDR family oxidoreductase [Sphingomonas chungangi]MVW55068.1 glucose 1-dehydrogenase [Sphingomonas chungangi]
MRNPSTDRLAGRAVIVTGAASRAGIGFATAERLAGERARVCLTDIDGPAVEARAADLRAAGADAIALAQDVTDEAGWEAVMRAAAGAFGRVDGLVNNAGIVVLALVEQLSIADWRRQIDVNLTSCFLGCRAAFAHFGEGGGAIVNVSSISGLIGSNRTTAYGASKGGMRLMTKSLAIEGGPRGIRVNTVHPGVTETDMQATARADASGDSASIAAAIPLRRTTGPDAIAAGIAFLLSYDADYVTGTELVIDGGLTAQ